MRVLQLIAVLLAGVVRAANASDTGAQATAHRAADGHLGPEVVITQALLGALGPELVTAMRSSKARPWTIDLPPGSAWRPLTSGFRRVLHGRAPIVGDTTRFYLRVEQDSATATRARYRVTIGQRWTCSTHPLRWVASDRSFLLQAVRDAASGWQVARAGEVTIGDRDVCD